MNEHYNPDRLDLARRRRGKSMHDIAIELDVPVVAVRRFLQYEEPSPAQLNTLAEFLHFPPEFFRGPTLDEPEWPSHFGSPAAK